MNTPFHNISRLFVAAALTTLPAIINAQTLLQGVEARLDVAHTVKNTPVIIDALRNDYESPWSGTLQLDKIVLKNHGEAEIKNGKIVFTPNPGFKGSALLNYTVCNNLKQCDCGLVIIDVADNPLLNYQEIKIFALEDATVTFTLPLGFKLQTPAKNGSITPTSQIGEWEYKPFSKFTGYDNTMFTFADNNGATKSYEAKFEVLKRPAQYVSNDIIATPIGKSVRFNVLDNDYRNGRINISYGTCTGGQIQGLQDGLVNFTPNPSFSGRASFNYTVTYNIGNSIISETATVLINVSNFLPDKEQFRLTCSGIPMVIKYAAPINTYRFEPLDEKTDKNGTIKFYTNIDTVISNQRIKGENILLYTPNLNAGSYDDSFWLRYCVGTECSDDYVQVLIDLIEPPTSEELCISECIWPGDANADGVVNILDLFPIGNNMGRYGLTRNDKSLEWYAHGGTDWGITIYNDSPVDLKHVDTNGDGYISAEDADAIVNHYSKNSTLAPYKSVQESAIEIQLISSVSSVRPGDMIEMIVSMGNAENPSYDTKGLSFALGYDAQLIKEESVKADFNALTWLSRYDAYLSLGKIVERGKLEAGLVRSKGKGANGHGEVGKVRAIVIDDVSGFRAGDNTKVKFQFENAMMMGANGQLIQLKTQDLEIPLVSGKKIDILKQDDLVMYPNPASDMVNFYINGVNTIEYVRIMDATGREVKRLNNIDAKSASIPVDASMRGFYIAEVMTEKGRIMKKLEIFK